MTTQDVDVVEVEQGRPEPEPDVEPTDLARRQEPRPVGRAQVLPPEGPPPRDGESPILLRQSEQVEQLYAALAEASGKFGEIERTLTAKIRSDKANYVYKYAPLSEVFAAIRPALSESGLAVMQFPFVRSRTLLLRTRLVHKSGQWIENDLVVDLHSNDPRVVGSAITYARRYGLMPMVGVAPDHDDDGETASRGDDDRDDDRRDIRPAARRSDQRPPEKEPEARPWTKASNVGVVTATERTSTGGMMVTLDTGFVAGTRDEALKAEARSYQSLKARVELSVRPASKPEFAPTLEKITLLPKVDDHATA